MHTTSCSLQHSFITRFTPFNAPLLFSSPSHGFLCFIHTWGQWISHRVCLFHAAALWVQLPHTPDSFHAMLIKSLSSIRDAPASNEDPADPSCPSTSSSNSVSINTHELFMLRVLSWLNDTSETQTLHRRISAKESIKAHIASAQSLLDAFDAATTNNET